MGNRDRRAAPRLAMTAGLLLPQHILHSLPVCRESTAADGCQTHCPDLVIRNWRHTLFDTLQESLPGCLMTFILPETAAPAGSFAVVNHLDPAEIVQNCHPCRRKRPRSVPWDTIYRHWPGNAKPQSSHWQR